MANSHRNLSNIHKIMTLGTGNSNNSLSLSRNCPLRMCKPLSWGVGRKTEREKIKALFHFFARCFSRCPRLQLIERLEEAKGVIEKNPNLRLTMDYEGLLKIEGFRLKKKKQFLNICLVSKRDCQRLSVARLLVNLINYLIVTKLLFNHIVIILCQLLIVSCFIMYAGAQLICSLKCPCPLLCPAGSGSWEQDKTWNCQ